MRLTAAARSEKQGFSRPANEDEGSPQVVSLGDSIAFGDDPNKPTTDASAFTAYPEVLGAQQGMQVANFGSPGETSSSALDVWATPTHTSWETDPATGKRVHNRPLKETFDVDQVDAASQYLAANPNTKLVTMTLGGNDLLMLEEGAKDSKLPTPVYELLHLPGAAIGIYKNVGTALGKLRGTGYEGPIVLTNQYSTNYSNPIYSIGLKAETLALRAAAHKANRPDAPVRIADVYKAFKDATQADPNAKGNPGAAGLLIPYENGYDKHPSLAGHQLIADAVAAANPDFPQQK